MNEDTQAKVMRTLAALREEMSNFFVDAVKLTNKAAARRARKISMRLRKDLKLYKQLTLIK